MEDKKVKELADDAYKGLARSGIDVLYDDRGESAGVKFKDADLIGIPVKIVVGSKNAKKDLVEVKDRKTGKVEEVASKELCSHIKALVK
jgi:prolyl-tRNA synthetase